MWGSDQRSIPNSQFSSDRMGIENWELNVGPIPRLLLLKQVRDIRALLRELRVSSLDPAF